jgi:hypothetical protein
MLTCRPTQLYRWLAEAVKRRPADLGADLALRRHDGIFS